MPMESHLLWISLPTNTSTRLHSETSSIKTDPVFVSAFFSVSVV